MKESCGVVAIASRNNVAESLYISLMALQHRGQEAAGIALYNGKIETYKGLGLVEEAFRKFDLKELKGNVGIGHTYYSVKISSPENAQPTLLHTSAGDIAIAHNGIIVNSSELKEELMNLFPEQIYREHLFIPLFKIDDSLYIAIANPLDTDLINTLSIQSNLDIHPLFSSPSAILEVINRFFGPDDKYFNIQDLIVSPQAIQRLPFWRESERVKVNLPIEFKPQDDRVLLVSSAYIPATCSDISMSGKAMGIKTFLFLPPQTELLIRFPSIDSQYQAKGEVVHCNMEERVRYFLGVKFLEMREDIIRKILEEGKGLDIKL